MQAPITRPPHRGGAARLKWVLPVAFGLALATPALAFVGFVTISPRKSVSVTIYNKADLTLVRDVRRTVMKAGKNTLRYQWAGTLIDPTSLMTFPPAGVQVDDTTYQLNEGESLVWNFKAARETSGPLGIQYFTSGMSWQADHMMVLTDEDEANLETWVKVTNNTGEDFDGTQIRLVVGEVKLVEEIANLARRFSQGEIDQPMLQSETKSMMYAAPPPADVPMMRAGKGMASGTVSEKAVAREELSELHLYQIEGTENIPNNGARRMRAFPYEGVKVRDVYRCVDPEGKEEAERVLSFKNTNDNKMGKQPLPEGRLQLFRKTANGLTYEGAGSMPYTPMKEEAEIPLGSQENVFCELEEIGVEHRNIQKNGNGEIKGHEEVTTYRLRLVNGSANKAFFEVRQYQEAPFHSTLEGAIKEDKETLLLKTTVGPAGSKVLTYVVTQPMGSLAEKKGQ